MRISQYVHFDLFSRAVVQFLVDRESYVAIMRTYNAGEGKRMRSWSLPFLARHSAFHTMDHVWELMDKDLTPSAG